MYVVGEWNVLYTVPDKWAPLVDPALYLLDARLGETQCYRYYVNHSFLLI